MSDRVFFFVFGLTLAVMAGLMILADLGVVLVK